MTWSQSATIAILVLVVTWWSTGWVNKIVASSILLLGFLAFSGAAPKTVFSFYLSENFPMIALTYLFSEGIVKSGLIEKLFLPFIGKFADTPRKVLAVIILMLIITIYLVPQPVARVIIIAALFDCFFNYTNIEQKTRSALLFGCFSFYPLVNMLCADADLILNPSVCAFAGVEMNNLDWIRNMAVPATIYGCLMFALFIFVFRNDLAQTKQISFTSKIEKPELNRTDKTAIIIITTTVLLWATKSIHGINNTIITFIAISAMFFTHMLEPKDLRAIDITTIVFLSAAFSTGGVLKESGAGNLIFTAVKNIFPNHYSFKYIILMALSAKLIHLILGSPTTTLSLFIPGMIIVSDGMLSNSAIMYISYASVMVHALLPFHSVTYMIGNVKGYYDAKNVLKFGVPMLFLMLFSVMFIFTPWWKFVGLF